MSNHNRSRKQAKANQAKQQRSRTYDARGTKSSNDPTRSNGGALTKAPTGKQGAGQGARLVLSGAKEHVEQLAHQTADMASNAAKVTAKAVRRATRATGKALGKTSDAAIDIARANPAPLILTGIGLACAGIGVSWLLAPKQSNLAQRVGAQATQIEQQVEAMIKEHPIAAGGVLLAVGAAIGLAIPRTVLEDTWIGHERDRLMKGARNLAEGVMEKGKALAEQVMPESPSANVQA